MYHLCGRKRVLRRRVDHRAGVTFGCVPTLLCSHLVVFQHVSDMNWTQFFCKSSNNAKLLSHLFSPWITYLFHYLFIDGRINENYSFYVYGSLDCMYLHHMYAWYPLRSEAGLDSCSWGCKWCCAVMWVLRIESISGTTVNVLNHWSISLVLVHRLLIDKWINRHKEILNCGSRCIWLGTWPDLMN